MISGEEEGCEEGPSLLLSSSELASEMSSCNNVGREALRG